MPKITPAHLKPNAYQKMSVKLAIQVLSSSVAAEIKTCVRTKQLKSKSALDTENFLENINNCFDTLNSKDLYDKNLNRRLFSSLSIFNKNERYVYFL